MKYSPFWKVVTLLCSQAGFTSALAAPSKPHTGGSYTVKSGDTFAKIARSRGISLGSLLQANRIANPDHIILGQHIIIPGTGAPQAKPVTAKSPARLKGTPSKQLPAPVAARRQPGNTTVNLTPPAPLGTWIVRSGDTLTRIQRETGIPLSTLMRLNGLTATSTLRVGQTLHTSGTATAKTATPVPSKPARFIQEIDSPRIIEQPHDQPLSPADAITPAAILDRTAPRPVTGTAPHKVESGETFSSIRRLYGLSEAQLASANRGVNPMRLRPGQTINIPGQPVSSQPKPQMVRADGRMLAEQTDPLDPDNNSGATLTSSRTRTGYLVEEGETLEEIARRFHTTEGALRSLNRLSDSDNIYGGRYILVPFLRQAPAGSQLANRQA